MEREYEGYWLAKGQYLVGKYRIEDVIDEGGMGIVYLGFDIVLQKYVSIKEYFPRRFAMRTHGEEKIITYKGRSRELYQQGLDKFVNEARILARFENMDSIVMVKDFFFANKTAYMVMEHVVGENVKQHVEREGRMVPEKVLGIMRPILYAVNELHKEGLLHRDISPDNIILTEEGKGVLIDFGAARFSDMQENKTMTVFFKRGYSAEEQYTEKAAKGAYTDVYGACTTMYFMLTGIRPEESVRRLIRDMVIPLAKFKDIKLEDYKKRCIMRGMSVEAKNRFASMEELCEILYDNRKNYAKKSWIIGAFIVIFIMLGVKFLNKNFTDSPMKTERVSNPVASGAATLVEKDAEFTNKVNPELSVKMINVVGKKKKIAVNRLKQLEKENLKVKIKWKYNSKIEKGCVIRQSIKAGTELLKSKKQIMVLTVSKGEKLKPTETPMPTQKPKEEEFVGKLPW